MIRLLCFLALVFVVGVSALDAKEPSQLEKGFELIFDGKSFKGWEGNMKWFRIEDGAIIAGSHRQTIPNNEFLCTTKTYGDFELMLKEGIRFRSAGSKIQKAFNHG